MITEVPLGLILGPLPFPPSTQKIDDLQVRRDLIDLLLSPNVRPRIGTLGFKWLRTGSKCCHEKLHLVNKVASLHLAPMDFLIGPSEMAPLAVLDDIALGYLFALVARKLDQNLAPTLRTITHWTKQM